MASSIESGEIEYNCDKKIEEIKLNQVNIGIDEEIIYLFRNIIIDK